MEVQRVVVFLFLFISGIQGQATLQSLYVDAARTTNGNGSPTSPWNDMNSAFAYLNARLGVVGMRTYWTINVSPGTYSVLTTLTGTTADLKIIDIVGSATNPPLFQCSNMNAFVSLIKGVGAAGFGAYNIKVQNCLGAVNLEDFDNVTLNSVGVSRCTSLNTSPVAIRAGPAGTIAAIFLNNLNIVQSRSGPGNGILELTPTAQSQAIVSNCYIGNNNVQTTAAGAIYTYISTQITNCLLENNIGNGAALALVQPLPSITTVTVTDMVIQNNDLKDVILLTSLTNGLRVFLKGATQLVRNTAANSVINSGLGTRLDIDANVVVTQNNIEGLSCAGGGAIFDAAGNNLCARLCVSGTYFDRCFVCGGNNTCLGCDGVPFSTATCSTPFTSNDNATFPGPILAWQGNSINPKMFPGPGVRQWVYILLGTIEEKDTGGNVLRSLDFNTLPWVIIVSRVNSTAYVRRYRYFATDGSNTIITVRQTLYREKTTINSGGITLTVGQSRVKYDLEIDQWPFSNTTQSNLVITLTLSENEPTLQNTMSSSPMPPFTQTSLSKTTPNTLVTANFQEWAVFDNVTKEIQVSLVSSSSNSSTFQFVLPYRFSNWLYDPDFGIVLTTQGTGDGDGGSAGDTDVIVGLTVGLGGFAVLAVVVVVVVGTAVGLWLRLRRNRKITGLVDSL